MKIFGHRIAVLVEPDPVELGELLIVGYERLTTIMYYGWSEGTFTL